jgi:plasmid maintenance system antidote protein VapI
MSLRKIAKEVGISKSYLSELLNGKKAIKEDMYIKLKKYYDLKLEVVLKQTFKVSSFKLKALGDDK